MRILELIGKVLRPVRSDDSRLVENSPAVSSHPKSLQLASPVFENGAAIPIDYSTDGPGKFPTIQWSGIPTSCLSLLLIIEDPDAPKPTPFVHGILYNIPPSLQEINENCILLEGATAELAALGVKFGKNTMSKTAYLPPAPPPGHGPHHYHFQLLALDTTLNFSGEATLDDIKKAIDNHVIAFGELVGVYER